MFERTGALTSPAAQGVVGAAGWSWTLADWPMSTWVGLFTIIYLTVGTLASAPKAIENVKRWIGWFRHG